MTLAVKITGLDKVEVALRRVEDAERELRNAVGLAALAMQDLVVENNQPSDSADDRLLG